MEDKYLKMDATERPKGYNELQLDYVDTNGIRHRLIYQSNLDQICESVFEIVNSIFDRCYRGRK